MHLWYRGLLRKVVLAMFAGTLTFSFSLLRHVEEASVEQHFEADAERSLAPTSDRQSVAAYNTNLTSLVTGPVIELSERHAKFRSRR
jgi:hypothetical protein